MKKVGFAMTSSFCTIKEILIQLKKLVEAGYDVVPITSPAIVEKDTRFGEARVFKEMIEDITGKNIVSNLIEAEKFGPKEPLDLLVVAPATGNFIGKFANGITDNTVCMAAKATLRNGSPIVIGISTNDALGFNGVNLMKLINSKNIFFIPFGQDDYVNKPNSLISHYNLLLPTIEAAFDGKQLQPVIQEYVRKK